MEAAPPPRQTATVDADPASTSAGPEAAPGGAPTIHKFGGSSVADAERIRRVAGLVAAEPGDRVVVVSALSGTTDRLVAAARAILSGQDTGATVSELRERHGAAADGVCPAEEREALSGEIDTLLARIGSARDAPWEGRGDELMDEIASIGEDLSARLVAAALRREGVASVHVDAREIVRTDDRFGRARPDTAEVRRRATGRLLPLLADGLVPVLQGFVGGAPDGRTTTLGRGGSDYTAAILGAALGAPMVHIWTDVDGILSADPRAVDHPRILPEIGYEEAVELSYFGAKVIHPGAAKHAVSEGVSLMIRNTFRPEGGGTLILADRRGAAEIAAVAYKPDVVMIRVRSHPAAMPYGFLARVFDVLGRHRLPVDLVATSHSSTAFTIDRQEDLADVREELSSFADVEVLEDLATVTVVGHGLMEEPGVDALVFWTVERTPVHLISQASDVSLSLVVDAERAPDLVKRLHLALIELRDEEGRETVE